MCLKFCKSKMSPNFFLKFTSFVYITKQKNWGIVHDIGHLNSDKPSKKSLC